LLPLFLGLTGYALTQGFEDSLEAAEAESLQSQVYLLLGAAELEDTQLTLPDAFAEPRFSQLNSGLLALVSNQKNERIWLSESGRLYADELDLRPSSEEEALDSTLTRGRTQFTRSTLAGKPFFIFTHDVSWDVDNGQEQLFRFSIYHEQSIFLAERRAYRAQLWRWLGAAGVLLVLMQWLILRWGLRPLRFLAADLMDIESGDSEQLKGDYPEEVQQVTDNLNAVLLREQQQRERYRNSLNDLAHSLKTPLAVLRSSLGSTTQAQDSLLESQVIRMDEIIGRQLQRAITRNLAPQDKVHNVEEIAQRLGNALEKVYRDKNIEFNVDISPDCSFNGDARDLMEVLGNILENAFKYCRQTVQLRASNEALSMVMRVGDDGPGIPAALQQDILKRGARADTAQTGQGIGLSMAVEIISGYGGSLELETSELGGAEFVISLPS